MKCSFCNKEIDGGILISIDGDFVCNDECKNAFHRNIDKICSMTGKEFEDWMGLPDCYSSKGENNDK